MRDCLLFQLLKEKKISTCRNRIIHVGSIQLTLKHDNFRVECVYVQHRIILAFLFFDTLCHVLLRTLKGFYYRDNLNLMEDKPCFPSSSFFLLKSTNHVEF